MEGVAMELLDLFDRGSAWAASKVPTASDRLDDPTPCDEWDVRALLNHMIDTLRYFAAAARGEDPPLPGPNPPDLIGQDPVATYEEARQETLRAHREPGALEKTGPGLGIAFADQLIHGADLAKATDQDATMPEALAQAAFAMLDGQLTDDRRGAAFKAAVSVAESAPPQDRLLAYTGRQP